MNLSRAEKYRRTHPLGFPHKPGDDFGWFIIPTTRTGPVIAIQVNSACPESDWWDHASASLAHRCPTWEEMCMIKDLLWNAEDCVVQFHPPKFEYINMAKHCLHLWCWRGGSMPRTRTNLVGV